MNIIDTIIDSEKNDRYIYRYRFKILIFYTDKETFYLFNYFIDRYCRFTAFSPIIDILTFKSFDIFMYRYLSLSILRKKNADTFIDVGIKP